MEHGTSAYQYYPKYLQCLIRNTMFSDSVLYYESNRNSILPFVAAPIARHQHTLVVAPIMLTQRHDDFITRLYSVSNLPVNGLCISVFEEHGNVVVCVMLSS